MGDADDILKLLRDLDPHGIRTATFNGVFARDVTSALIELRYAEAIFEWRGRWYLYNPEVYLDLGAKNEIGVQMYRNADLAALRGVGCE